MEEKRPSNLLLNWPGLLLLAAVAGGWWALQTPLSSSRPGGKAETGATLIGDQVVDSRLWQDPFEAIKVHRESQGEARAGADRFDLAELTGQIARRLRSKPRVRVVPVMVAGGSYVEDYESRLRGRFAILSALNHAGLKPGDAEHIGYCVVPWVRGAVLEADAANPQLTPVHGPEIQRLIIPYEWFEPGASLTAQAVEPVLLLWLRDEAFADFPLTRLAVLIDQLRDRTAKALPAHALAGRLVFSIIGPRGSDTLQSMLRDDQPVPREYASAPDRSGVFTEVAMFSPWATAPDAVLHSRSSGEGRAQTTATLRQKGLAFTNVVPTDDKLVRELILELRRRGKSLWADPQATNEPPEVHVALVAEWDTLYGRSLPLAFAAELERYRELGPGAETNFLAPEGTNKFYAQLAAPGAKAPGVHLFTYFRGVDGKLSPYSPTPAGGGTRPKDRSDPATTVERPEGPGQLDAVPRLVQRIKELDQELMRGGRGEIEVIGVVGSDVYDKLLLLQSLRPHFTDEIFFTTDLDARLLHPSEQKWSRNLIVASGYGLTLTNSLQGAHPPFRETYQAAQYLACLAALGFTNFNAAALDRQRARLFEIGQKRAVDLSVADDPAGVHPKRRDVATASTPWRGRLVLAAGLFAEQLSPWLLPGVLMVALLTYFSQTVRALLWIWFATLVGVADAPRPRWFRLLVWVATLSPVLFVALVCWDHTRAEGEPFSLVDGVSIWPAEALRLLAIYLSLALLFAGRFNLRQNRDKLTEQFALCSGDQARRQTLALWKKARRWLVEPLSPRQPLDASETHDAAQREPGWDTAMLRAWDWLTRPQPGLRGLAAAVSRLVRVFREHVDKHPSSVWRACLRTAASLERSLAYLRWISLSAWAREPVAPGKQPPWADEIWQHYVNLGWLWHRVFRFAPAAAISFSLGVMLVWLFDLPFQPARGALSFWVDTGLQFLSFALQILLTFFVVDATLLDRKFIANLTEQPTRWSDQTVSALRCSLPPPCQDEWLAVQLIAERTRVTAQLIWFPSLVLFLLIVSRSEFFDRWDWPLSILLVLGLNSAYALYAVFVLHRAAETARRTCLERLNLKLVEALGAESKPADAQSKSPAAAASVSDTSAKSPAASNAQTPPPSVRGSPKLADQLRVLIRSIEDCEEGAFCPLARQPVIGALAMPFGGAGILGLLDVLARM
jgi:hypothetical protein